MFLATRLAKQARLTSGRARSARWYRLAAGRLLPGPGAAAASRGACLATCGLSSAGRGSHQRLPGAANTAHAVAVGNLVHTDHRDTIIQGIDRSLQTGHQALNGLTRQGRIDIICGPMFAGKTTALLARAVEAQSRGEKVLVLKSAVDNRYSETTVVSHDGQEMVRLAGSADAFYRLDCMALDTLEQLKERLTDAELNEPQVIAIDEAQFFPDLVEFCLQAAEERNQQVVVAGLDSDFRRQKFGQILDLACVADSVTKLTARCAHCSARAIFSMRTVASRQTTLVGGAESYQPACRACYVRLQKS